MSKIKFLVDNFPNVDWNYEWYSGQFFAEDSFPPLFHYLGGVLVGWFGISLGDALIGIAALSLVTTACALYGLVRLATESRLAGLVAALTLLASSAYWSYVIDYGLYPRILGMAFLSLFAFFAFRYYTRPSSPVLAAMVLSLAATLSTHLLLGFIGLALAILLIVVLPSNFQRKAVEAIRLLVPTGLIVAYFYLPYLAALSRPAPVPTFTRIYSPVALKSLLSGVESLPFFLLPFAVLAPIAASRYRQLPRSPMGRRLTIVVAVSGAAALVYALVGLPVPHLFIYNFQPGQAMFFAAWFLAALLGLSLSWLKLRPELGYGTVAALVAVIVVTTPAMANRVISGDNPDKRALQSALMIDPNQKVYRVGVSWDGGSDWIDSRSDVPQTRGYQQQGVLDPDWQYWLETAVWSPESNYDETNFLLDWYAVKSFYGGPNGAVENRFAARPDLYAPQNQSAQTFDYVNASPILSARATRTALVIGNDVAYSFLLRALALSGFDSHSLIPVRGGDYLDDHSASELRRFDLVLLYGYQVHDLAKSFALLNDYVERGGSVMIEANNSPLRASGSAPVPIPGLQIRTAQINRDWKLSSTASAISSGLDLGLFAPAVYAGGPWGISYIPQSALAPWAEPVLLSDGRPVLVAGALGQGHVVWSGMNLAYHAASTRTAEESRLLARAIAWAAPKVSTQPAYQSNWVNPQLRRITVTEPAAGVLLKENWVANWQATVDGRPAAIYRAGPDFMYVPMGSGVTYPAAVEFDFERTAIEWIGDGVSIVSLVGLIVWLGVQGVRRRGRRVSGRPS